MQALVSVNAALPSLFSRVDDCFAPSRLNIVGPTWLVIHGCISQSWALHLALHNA